MPDVGCERRGRDQDGGENRTLKTPWAWDGWGGGGVATSREMFAQAVISAMFFKVPGTQ